MRSFSSVTAKLVNTRRYTELLNKLDLTNVTVVELGAGDGTLTDIILAMNPKKVITYEANEESVNKLRERIDSSALEIKNVDFTEENFDFLKEGEHVLIANPPEQTISHIVKNIIKKYDLQDVILMTSDNNIAKYFSGYQVAFTVSRRDFLPRVGSKFVVMQKGFHSLQKRLSPEIFNTKRPTTKLFALNDARVAIACSRTQVLDRYNQADRTLNQYMQYYAEYTLGHYESNGWPVDRRYEPNVLKNGLMVHVGEPIPKKVNPYSRYEFPAVLRTLNNVSAGDPGRPVKESLHPELSGFIPAGKNSGWLVCATVKRNEIYAYQIASTQHLGESYCMPINDFGRVDSFHSDIMGAMITNSSAKASFCLYTVEAPQDMIRDLVVMEEEKGSHQLAVLLNTGKIDIGEVNENKWVLKKSLQLNLSEKSGKTRIYYSTSQDVLFVQDGHHLFYHFLDEPTDNFYYLRIPRLFNVSLSCNGNYLSGLQGEGLLNYVHIIDLSELKSKKMFTPHVIFFPRKLNDFVIGYEDRVCIATVDQLLFYPSLASFLQDRYQLLKEMAPQIREPKYAAAFESDSDSEYSSCEGSDGGYESESDSDSDSPRSATSSSVSQGFGLFSLFGGDEKVANDTDEPRKSFELN